MTNNIPKLEEQYIWLKDNEQITTLNQLTQLSLNSYPFAKQSQKKSHYSLGRLAESVCL